MDHLCQSCVEVASTTYNGEGGGITSAATIHFCIDLFSKTTLCLDFDVFD